MVWVCGVQSGTMIRTVLLTTLICLLSTTVLGQTPAPTFEELFRDGLSAYQTKAYDKAQDLFTQALNKEPGNTAAMVNEALTAFQLDKKGLAIAWFRRALMIEPDLLEAQAGLKFASAKLEIKEIPHRIETFETIRANVLELAPLRVFLAITALMILVGGWLFIGWFGAYRRALRSQEVAPGFSLFTGLLITLALAGIVLTSLKITDSTWPRGTIISKKVDARSAPADTGVALFQLYEGFEVLIREVKDGWVQVTYPGGLTGWVQKTDLLPNDALAASL